LWRRPRPKAGLWSQGKKKREDVAGGWRRLYNEERHNLYASSNIIRVIKSRKMRGVGYVTHMRQLRNAYKILVGKPEGKRPPEKSRRRCGNNIRMDLREIWWESMD
jgi:hypothetical protein